MMNIRVNGAWKEITSGKIFVGGAWKDITRGQVRIAGDWKAMGNLVADLSLQITPTTVSGSRVGSGVITSNIAQATPSGGNGPFSYSWQRISGSGSPTSPTSARTAITDIIAEGQITSAQFQCTVTDSIGNTATANLSSSFFASTQEDF